MKKRGKGASPSFPKTATIANLRREKKRVGRIKERENSK